MDKKRLTERELHLFENCWAYWHTPMAARETVKLLTAEIRRLQGEKLVEGRK